MTNAASSVGGVARVCVVTGANRGIGRAVALGLARTGASVVMICRDAARGAAARDALRRESGNDRIALVVADLGSFAAIRHGAAEILARHPAIDVLVHNAGVHRARRTLSADGIEMTFAVNHLGAFLLTELLLPGLRARPSRIVTVSSEFERFGALDFRDLQGARRYIGVLAYMRSKRANVLFTLALAERLAGSGVTATCVYPGLVATDLLRERWWWRARWLRPLWATLFLAPEVAARRIVALATAPAFAGVSGVCFAGQTPKPVRVSAGARDANARARLWAMSEELTR